ncbi:MAG TPA: hypothetical protein VJ842_14330 [Pyrinomonadaceae bacterium]|nr:hypothetical protein [Pyrinomonadaceae bacterium]
MNTGQLVAFGVLAIGVLYLAGYDVLGLATTALSRITNPNLSPAEQQAIQSAAQVAGQQAGAFEQSAPARSAGGGVAATAGAATSAAGIATGAGLAGATIALTAGIAAAAGLLVWGIAKRGWFRGGEEGISVNPARDQFIDVWIQQYYPGAGSERQYDAMASAFNDAGVNGITAQNTIAQLYAADTMAELEIAARNFINVLQLGAAA